MITRTSRTSGHGKATSRIRLQIAGMSCGSCVNRVRSALAGIEGARVIDVRPGSAAIELQPEVDGHAVVSAIAAAGYEVMGVDPLDAPEESAMRRHPVSGGGCCCGPEAVHQDVSSGPARR